MLSVTAYPYLQYSHETESVTESAARLLWQPESLWPSVCFQSQGWAAGTNKHTQISVLEQGIWTYVLTAVQQSPLHTEPAAQA